MHSKQRLPTLDFNEIEELSEEQLEMLALLWNKTPWKALHTMAELEDHNWSQTSLRQLIDLIPTLDTLPREDPPYHKIREQLQLKSHHSKQLSLTESKRICKSFIASKPNQALDFLDL